MTRTSAEPGSTPATSPRETLFESGSLGEARATVCVTLYDYERTIGAALTSVFEQTLDALALVVVDDRSRDDGCARVESWMRSFASRFAGLQLARHESNQGLAHARNGAVELCRSEYVMILDADNLLYPRCVERLLESLEGSSHAFAYPMIEKFGQDHTLISAHPWSVDHFKKGNYVDAMAMIRRSVWSQVGGYSQMRVSGWEDYDFWCKCVEAGHEGLLVPEILARYRQHDASMLQTETNFIANQRRLREEMTQRHPWLELRELGEPKRDRPWKRGRSPYVKLLERR